MGVTAEAIWAKGKICGGADMIFVTVGNHFQSFDRLIKKVDEIAPLLSQEIVIQKGYSRYTPQNTTYFDFVPLKSAMEYIRTSDLVISHAGFGTIILCKEYGTPLLIFPRRKKHGEHMNDHQIDIANVLEERKDDRIYIVYEEGHLEEKIVEILRNQRKPVPVENVGKDNLIRVIREFIERNRS